MLQLDLLEVMYRCARHVIQKAAKGVLEGKAGRLFERLLKAKKTVDLAKELREVLMAFNESLGARARCVIMESHTMSARTYA